MQINGRMMKKLIVFSGIVLLLILGAVIFLNGCDEHSEVEKIEVKK